MNSNTSDFRELKQEEKVAFAREFRAARAIAVQDSECFEEFLFALERLGSYRTRSQAALGRYKCAIKQIACKSALASSVSTKHPTLHLSFDVLYESVREGRNDALHQGTIARHLAAHAQELALIIEDALMSDSQTAAEFMARDPVCAELWQPLSAIRRTMLLNAFSYLPYRSTASEYWRMISDSDIARYLRCKDERTRSQRLLMTLQEALGDGLTDKVPSFCKPDDAIEGLADKIESVPYLVISAGGRLEGVITAFDLL